MLDTTQRAPGDDMVEKSPDAFRTISEVAEELDLPQHVLRFWETRFPQIKPLKRGGGRRYYRPDDVALITGLKTLLYAQGYTIKGVQRILKEQGVRAVQTVGRGGALPVAGGASAPSAPASLTEVAPLDVAPFTVRPAAPRAGEPSSEAPRRDAAQGDEPRAPSAAARPATPPRATAGLPPILREALVEIETARNRLVRVLQRTDSQT